MIKFAAHFTFILLIVFALLIEYGFRLYDWCRWMARPMRLSPEQVETTRAQRRYEEE